MKYCGNCGCELTEEAKFCPNCASVVKKEIKEVKAPDAEKAEQKNKKNKKAFVISTLIAVLAVIGIGVFFMIKGSKNAEDTAVEADYDNLFQDGLALVEQDGLYGYVNQRGKEVVKPQYEYAEPFSEGLALVEVDGKYGFIDTKGEMVIEAKFGGACSFSEGLAVVNSGIMYQDLYEGMGCIDKEGNYVISPEFLTILPFSEGLAVATKWIDGETYGTSYIDKTGQFVMEQDYVSAYSFKNGIAKVRTNVGMDSYNFINKQGELLFDNNVTACGEFENGLAPVMLSNKVLLEMYGEEFFEELKEIYGTWNIQPWGYMNMDGDIVIKPIYLSVSSFKDGIATVYGGKHAGVHLIDTKGEVVQDTILIKCYSFPPNKQGFVKMIDSNVPSYAVSYIMREQTIMVNSSNEIQNYAGEQYIYRGNQQIFINKNYCDYEEIFFDDEYVALVTANKKYTIVDKNGTVISKEYDGIGGNAVTLCKTSGCTHSSSEDGLCQEHTPDFAGTTYWKLQFGPRDSITYYTRFEDGMIDGFSKEGYLEFGVYEYVDGILNISYEMWQDVEGFGYEDIQFRYDGEKFISIEEYEVQGQSVYYTVYPTDDTRYKELEKVFNGE